MTEQHDEISIFEWIIAAVGMIMVLASIAFIAYQGITTPRSPPDIRVRTIRIARSGDGYLVLFTAENLGGTTVAELSIEGEIERGGGTEISEATIDYLPPRSQRSGGLFFENHPSGVELRARGFVEP